MKPTVQTSNAISAENSAMPLRIFTLSSADENGIDRLVAEYAEYFSNPPESPDEAVYMGDLAYTLCDRRSRLSWT